MYLFAVPVVLGLFMVWEHHRGTVPLLSLRNLSLIGLIVFQYFSGGLHLWTDDYAGFPVQDPSGTGLVYAAILTAFTVVYLLMYKFGWPMRGIANRFPLTNTTPRDPTLMLMATVFLGLGFVFTMVPIPYIGIITNYFGIALIAVAAGFAGWVIVRNYLNPVYYLLGGSLLFPAMIISVLGTYGRRHLVAVVFAFVWGAFYGRFRQMKLAWLISGTIIAAIPAVYALSAFTGVRNISEQTTATTLLRGLASPDFKRTIPDLLSGQSCGPVSFFVLENYPENFQGTFLNNFTYFFVMPVPRAIWPDKPETVSNEIAYNSNLAGVAQGGITLPPGVVGYIAAEGGIFAFFVYAWFFGVSLRFFDQLIVRAPANPLIIMPVGCALGQILGLFRGEMSMFLFIHVTGFVGSYTACLLVGKALGNKPDHAALFDEHHDTDDHHAVAYHDSVHEHETEWDTGTHDGFEDYGHEDERHHD